MILGHLDLPAGGGQGRHIGQGVMAHALAGKDGAHRLHRFLGAILGQAHDGRGCFDKPVGIHGGVAGVVKLAPALPYPDTGPAVIEVIAQHALPGLIGGLGGLGPMLQQPVGIAGGQCAHRRTGRGMGPRRRQRDIDIGQKGQIDGPLQPCRGLKLPVACIHPQPREPGAAIGTDLDLKVV